MKYDLELDVNGRVVRDPQSTWTPIGWHVARIIRALRNGGAR